MKKYVGILNNDGSVTAASYSPMLTANAANDLLNDQRVEKYKLGFDTEQEALDWAKAQ